jgi:hypothetical protein
MKRIHALAFAEIEAIAFAMRKSLDVDMREILCLVYNPANNAQKSSSQKHGQNLVCGF